MYVCVYVHVCLKVRVFVFVWCIYVQLVDRILEELQRGLESPYKREIQRLLGIARLLSEVLLTVTSIFKYILTYIHTYYFQLENEYRNNFIHTVQVQVHTSVLKFKYIHLSLPDVQLCGGFIVAHIRYALPLDQLRSRGGRAARFGTHTHTCVHTYIKY